MTRKSIVFVGSTDYNWQQPQELVVAALPLLSAQPWTLQAPKRKAFYREIDPFSLMPFNNDLAFQHAA